MIEIATTIDCSNAINPFLKPIMPPFKIGHTDIPFGELKRRYYLTLDALIHCNKDKQSMRAITPRTAR